jgi:hypothetical protein
MVSSSSGAVDRRNKLRYQRTIARGVSAQTTSAWSDGVRCAHIVWEATGGRQHRHTVAGTVASAGTALT